MHIISIYNNKGGVGKSTLTVGLAEFLSANRGKKVLVIDLDAQASTTSALLSRETIRTCLQSQRTIVGLVNHLRRRKSVPKNLSDYLVPRPAVDARGSALGELAILVPDRTNLYELEERMRSRNDETLLRDYLKPALANFDFVLIDMPGNADRRQKLVINGLTISDFVLVPTKPDQISLEALPDSFDLVHYAQEVNGQDRPAIIGIVRNMTDRRTQQYKAKFPSIIEASASQNLPPLFENFLANHSALETATDGTQDFRTLKQRFANDYDPVRKVACELEKRCKNYQFHQKPKPSEYGQFFRRILDTFSTKR